MQYYNCPFNYINDYNDYDNYGYDELYRTESMPSQITNIYSYPQNLQAALGLIQDSVAGEREDELFYNYLLNTAPSSEAKRIISGIRDDEKSIMSYLEACIPNLRGKHYLLHKMNNLKNLPPI
ncbi:hypothetical protein CLAUR_019810 [Clostridium felsineum]|nr:hypothetical protein CLAUR_019810 [Clostridium felsineum]